MKYLGVISFLFLLVTLTSCHEENPNLKAAYSYIDSNHLDSAKLCLDRVDVKSLGEADQAFYYLVKTRWDYVNYIPIAKDDLIRRSVAYYEKEGNDSLLAESLFYQAVVLSDNGNKGEAFRLLKQAEFYAGIGEDDALKHKIAEALTGYSMQGGEFEMALGYATYTLSLSRKLKDPNKTGYAYAYLSEIYKFLGKKDSAHYYMERCMDFIDDIPLPERGDFYSYLATMYMATDRKKAEEYALLGYNIKKSSSNCCVLAQLRYVKGDRIAVDALFSQALSLAKSVRDSVGVYSNMVSIYKNMHDYQKAFSSHKLLYRTHKHLDNIIRENDIKAEQLKFDMEMEKSRLRQFYLFVIGGVLVLVLLFLFLWIYRRYRFNEVFRKVMENELLIHSYKSKIEEMNTTQVKERAHYARELSKLQERQSKMLSRGRDLYRHVVSGGTIVRWNNNDMKFFMEYYKLVDLSFVKRLEEDYDHLSLRYKFYMVLEHMGKNDEEVQCVMGISPSSVRSIKSRIKSKYKGL